ncbi:MAG: RNA methyltransferase [Candidatus Zambryskibacteria bacterium CG_4_9_14_3_um_filter_42_9]|uniref:RNA methyltransferase n=1 Tax=Candidatus Zambryskibacteria bacterium CG22_combo_CG10-13_8_21_14_all_42_17 TaxID=1975118 RepID=A0A2H0BFW3_9BACT|nr:MAG: RNA methyltransferase [Candidatus Zambryskibacteria bacterium CG22_combo_CG10-13_8_21_14_all_42_17]PJA36786.1 MAG: RNA methyltransferase [Candidatus Zambryskibacteria bacterium CG_4_9_14_3_um_filter_42_9]
MNPVRSKKSRISADLPIANRTSNGMKKCILVLDNIRSVANVGSIFRTADAMGVLKVILVGTTPAPIDRFGRKRRDFSKVSLGAENSVPWEYVKVIESAIEELKESKFEIVALEQIANAENIRDFKPRKDFALIVGNEVSGISKEALDMADKVVEISMMGTKESLNVSVATGVALHCLLTVSK